MSGFISGLFGLLLTIALTLTVVFWQEKKLRRARVLGIISFICAIITVVAYWFYYLSPTKPGPPEKSYVFIKQARMDDLSVGKTAAAILEVQNGPAEATFVFRDITYILTRTLPVKSLRYSKGGIATTLKLAPNQVITSRWALDDIVLTQTDIDELDASKPSQEFYILARGEYTNESGKHSLDVCFKYAKDFPTHLAICSDEIKIEQ